MMAISGTFHLSRLVGLFPTVFTEDSSMGRKVAVLKEDSSLLKQNKTVPLKSKIAVFKQESPIEKRNRCFERRRCMGKQLLFRKKTVPLKSKIAVLTEDSST